MIHSAFKGFVQNNQREVHLSHLAAGDCESRGLDQRLPTFAKLDKKLIYQPAEITRY